MEDVAAFAEAAREGSGAKPPEAKAWSVLWADAATASGASRYLEGSEAIHVDTCLRKLDSGAESRIETVPLIDDVLVGGYGFSIRSNLDQVRIFSEE